MQEMRNTSYSHKKERACPFFLSKEIIESADILSMPYNYLLDPMMRKANNLELPNTIIIPDEAHNVEKTCEESASMQIRPTDKACIDIIKYVDYEGDGPLGGYNEAKKNFTIDDLALLKEMQLERTGTCIFEIFDNITSKEVITYHVVAHLLNNIIQYIATITEMKNLCVCVAVDFRFWRKRNVKHTDGWTASKHLFPSVKANANVKRH
ncbi:regulator of telomere elongation helicase 1 homolog [Armigeres subalbatus]|uniref:regulator of telomere elongation helicase 1 homolog n=1 Tax=Armigeres subalbatus TaxID=124917 RepID=UPI002ED1EC61